MKKLFSLLLSFLLIFSLVVPASASELDSGIATLDENVDIVDSSLHGNMCIEWTYEDVVYSFTFYRGSSYALKYPPLYVTWDNGVVFQIETSDIDSRWSNLVICANGSIVETFSATTVTYDNKTVWQFIFGPNTSYYGLSFSSLSDFRDCLDPSTYNIYYIADREADLSTAIHFSLADLSGSDGNTGGNVSGSGGSFTAEEKSTLFTWLSNIYNAIVNGFTSLSGNIGSYFSDLGNYLGGKLDALYNFFVEENENGETTGRNLWDWLAELSEDFEKIVQDITTAIEGVVEDITFTIESVVGDVVDGIVDIYEIVSEFFLNFFDKLVESIQDLLTYLFVPSDGYFENILGDVNGKYDGNTRNSVAILSTIKGFATQLNDFLHQDFSNISAPSIKVNLSAYDGEIEFGDRVVKVDIGDGSVNAIDFSWFAKYRHLTDPFISAMLWIAFMWLLVKRLPDILSAVGMTTDGGIVAMNSVYTQRENTRMAQERSAAREAEAEHRKSYEYYKENRSRSEAYSARYNKETGKSNYRRRGR